MIGQDIIAGLKVSSSKIQVVELNLRSGVAHVRDLYEVFFNEKIDFNQDKETKIGALLQGAFNEILLQKPLKNINVSVTIPQSLVYSFQSPFEESLLYSDLIEEFRWQFSLLYPFIDSNELMIQYYPLQKNNFNAGNTAFVTAVPRNIVRMFTDFCNANSFKLRFIDSFHNASDKALITSRNIKEEKLLLSLLVGDKKLSFIFYSFGEPFLFSSIDYQNASEIPELVINEISNKNLSEPIRTSYICGDEISHAFIEKLSERTNISFSSFNPFSGLQLDTQVLENKFYLLKNNSFSPAVGISIRSY